MQRKHHHHHQLVTFFVCCWVFWNSAVNNVNNNNNNGAHWGRIMYSVNEKENESPLNYEKCVQKCYECYDDLPMNYLPSITSDGHSIRLADSVRSLDESLDRLVVVASYVLDCPSCSPLLLDRRQPKDLHGVWKLFESWCYCSFALIPNAFQSVARDFGQNEK